MLITLAMAIELYTGTQSLDDNARGTREANDHDRGLFSFALSAHRYMNAFGGSLGQRTLIANQERRVVGALFEQLVRDIPRARPHSGAASHDWDSLRAISADLSRELEKADARRAAGDFYEAERIFNRARSVHFEGRMLPWFDRAIRDQRANVQRLESQALSEGHRLRVLGATLAISAAFLAALVMLVTLRSVLGPVGLLVHGTAAIAKGDYKHRLRYQGTDELGVLARHFDDMAEVVEKSQSSLIEKNQALEQAYQLQGQFLSVMSHELRSPLNSILGYTELVLEDGSSLPEIGRRNLNNIANGAQRLLALINDILDFSKLKAGRVRARRKTFAVAELTKHVVDDARALVRGRALEVGLQVADDVPATFCSDETMVRQILTNLISNAVKFTDTGRVMLLVERGTHGDLLLSVTDTGIGIAPDQFELIFEPFRQTHGTDQLAVGGTGLGLAIVARLCGLLGGSVSLQSTLGQGSRFSVSLPMQTSD